MKVLWHILNANDQEKNARVKPARSSKNDNGDDDAWYKSTLMDVSFCSFFIQPTANTAATCSKPSSQQVLQATSGSQD